MLNYFGKLKCIVSAVGIAGALLLLDSTHIAASTWKTVEAAIGAVLLFGAAIYDLLFDRCPYCEKYLHTTIGLHACPYCGANLDDYHPSNG